MMVSCMPLTKSGKQGRRQRFACHRLAANVAGFIGGCWCGFCLLLFCLIIESAPKSTEKSASYWRQYWRQFWRKIGVNVGAKLAQNWRQCWRKIGVNFGAKLASILAQNWHKIGVGFGAKLAQNWRHVFRSFLKRFLICVDFLSCTHDTS